MAPATGSVMGSIPEAKAGIGSAMNDVNRQVGGALGVAIIGSAMNSAYRARINGAAQHYPPASVTPPATRSAPPTRSPRISRRVRRSISTLSRRTHSRTRSASASSPQRSRRSPLPRSSPAISPEAGLRSGPRSRCPSPGPRPLGCSTPNCKLPATADPSYRRRGQRSVQSRGHAIAQASGSRDREPACAGTEPQQRRPPGMTEQMMLVRPRHPARAQSGSRDALPRPCPLRTVRAGQSPHTAQASREGVAG